LVVLDAMNYGTLSDTVRFKVVLGAQLIALKKFERDVGVSSTTTWRWTRLGWLHPVRIANKLYLTAADIEQFIQRAQRGELAGELAGVARKEVR